MPILAAALLSLVLWQAPARTPDIHFTPTRHNIADAMLKLANVTGADVVLDLGSGDGRIPIIAAQKYGARGIGIEIDPRLVAQSTESARRAGVADRVSFRAGDLFDTDLSDATVVTLYLSPELNLRLRPKLLHELRPGSRIVSHDFPMGDWPPQHTIRVASRDRTSTVYLWIVPPKTATPR